MIDELHRYPNGQRSVRFIRIASSLGFLRVELLVIRRSRILFLCQTKLDTRRSAVIEGRREGDDRPGSSKAERLHDCLGASLPCHANRLGWFRRA